MDKQQIEIIKIRMPEISDRFKEVIHKLMDDIQKDGKAKSSVEGVQLYYSITWENDVTLILSHGEDAVFPSGKSDTAHHICEALKPFGLIHHMIWKQITDINQL